MLNQRFRLMYIVHLSYCVCAVGYMRTNKQDLCPESIHPSLSVHISCALLQFFLMWILLLFVLICINLGLTNVNVWIICTCTNISSHVFLICVDNALLFYDKSFDSLPLLRLPTLMVSWKVSDCGWKMKKENRE